ncbi:MAG TPA: hypothetical protein VG722_09525, partial [Tepidisphaeraceae bacterium]|nr:hypothetical protein [Tepidisphaeraceae bacterium]
EVEPHLMPYVRNPRDLDRFVLAGPTNGADDMAIMVRALAAGLVVRSKDNRYLVQDASLHAPLELVETGGCVGRGVDETLMRLKSSPLLTRRLQGCWQQELTAGGKEKMAGKIIAAIDNAASHVRAESVPNFTTVAVNELRRLLPGCSTLQEARRFLGTGSESPATPDSMAPVEMKPESKPRISNINPLDNGNGRH